MADSDPKDMTAILSKHYLGEFKMRLGNITCTELVRPLSKNGLKYLEQSIREVGWLENFAPSVVVQQDRLGSSNELTAEAALTTPAHTLDGNHRITTLRKIFGESALVTVRVYFEFNQGDELTLANGEFLTGVMLLCACRCVWCSSFVIVTVVFPSHRVEMSSVRRQLVGLPIFVGSSLSCVVSSACATCLPVVASV